MATKITGNKRWKKSEEKTSHTQTKPFYSESTPKVDTLLYRRLIHICFNMFIGQSVITLGNIAGTIKAIRSEDGVVIIEPTSWKLANNCTPVFYMNPKDVKTLFAVDDMVSCSFGKGQIKDIRADGIHIVTLANWALADGKSPVLYMQESALSKYVPTIDKPIKQSNYVQDCLEKAQRFKTEATSFYKSSNFEQARGKYLEALGALHV